MEIVRTFPDENQLETLLKESDATFVFEKCPETGFNSEIVKIPEIGIEWWISVDDWGEIEDDFFHRAIFFNIKTGDQNFFGTNFEETKFYAKFELDLEIPENMLDFPIKDQKCLKSAGKLRLRSDALHKGGEDSMNIYFMYEPSSKQQEHHQAVGNFVCLAKKEKNDYKIKCRVEITVARENFDKITGCVGTSSTLAPVGQLLDTQDFSDFKFIVSGEEFKVHRSVLSLASPYFATLFKSDFKENQENEEKVLNNNENPVIFQLLLEFIYKGKLPDNFSDVAMDLYVMADHYLMDILKTYCLNHVNALTINKKNALKIYKFALKYQQTGLFELSWMFISSNFLYSPKFETIRNNPLKVDEIEKLVETIQEFDKKLENFCDKNN